MKCPRPCRHSSGKSSRSAWSLPSPCRRPSTSPTSRIRQTLWPPASRPPSSAEPRPGDGHFAVRIARCIQRQSEPARPRPHGGRRNLAARLAPGRGSVLDRQRRLPVHRTLRGHAVEAVPDVRHRRGTDLHPRPCLAADGALLRQLAVDGAERGRADVVRVLCARPERLHGAGDGARRSRTTVASAGRPSTSSGESLRYCVRDDPDGDHLLPGAEPGFGPDRRSRRAARHADGAEHHDGRWHLVRLHGPLRRARRGGRRRSALEPACRMLPVAQQALWL